jgi:hypothetical protein
MERRRNLGPDAHGPTTSAVRPFLSLALMSAPFGDPATDLFTENSFAS